MGALSGHPRTGYRIDFTFEYEFDFNIGYEIFDIQGKQKASIPDATLQDNDLSFENEYYHLNIEPNGSLTLLDKAANHTYRNLLTFEDVGDAGDTYNFSPVTEDTVVTTEQQKLKSAKQAAETLKLLSVLHYKYISPKNW